MEKLKALGSSAIAGSGLAVSVTTARDMMQIGLTGVLLLSAITAYAWAWLDRKKKGK